MPPKGFDIIAVTLREDLKEKFEKWCLKNRTRPATFLKEIVENVVEQDLTLEKVLKYFPQLRRIVFWIMEELLLIRTLNLSQLTYIFAKEKEANTKFSSLFDRYLSHLTKSMDELNKLRQISEKYDEEAFKKYYENKVKDLGENLD